MVYPYSHVKLFDNIKTSGCNSQKRCHATSGKLRPVYCATWEPSFISTPTFNTQFQMYFGTNVRPRPKKFEKKIVFQCHLSIEAQPISVANTCICYRKRLSFNRPVTLENEFFFQIILVWAENLYQNTFETECCKWGWK